MSPDKNVARRLATPDGAVAAQRMGCFRPHSPSPAHSLPPSQSPPQGPLLDAAARVLIRARHQRRVIAFAAGATQDKALPATTPRKAEGALGKARRRGRTEERVPVYETRATRIFTPQPFAISGAFFCSFFFLAGLYLDTCPLFPRLARPRAPNFFSQRSSAVTPPPPYRASKFGGAPNASRGERGDVGVAQGALRANKANPFRDAKSETNKKQPSQRVVKRRYVGMH